MDVINLIGGLLYQWDTGRKVKIVPRDGITVDEVQFSNGLQDALVVEPYTEEGEIYANIPNILLQAKRDVSVYVVMYNESGEQTVCSRPLVVNGREKPADYVYTETEVKSYETLEKRITALEGGGGAADAVKYTEQELTDEQRATARANIGADGVEWIPTALDSTTCSYFANMGSTTWIKDMDVAYSIASPTSSNTTALNRAVQYLYWLIYPDNISNATYGGYVSDFYSNITVLMDAGVVSSNAMIEITAHNSRRITALIQIAYSASEKRWAIIDMRRRGCYMWIVDGVVTYNSLPYYYTDDTLSISGRPADAKATGEAIATAKAEVEEQIVQSDWAQNDSTQPDYVKNRPFYTSDLVETVLIEEQTVTIDNDDYYIQLDGSLTLAEGDIYKVTLNGIEYELIAKFGEQFGCIYIGNGNMVDETTEDTQPFAVDSYENGEIYLDVAELGDYTISISGKVFEVHKIDEKYLPDGVSAEAISNVQTTADGKMNVENPVGIGSFSMNRKEGTVVGGYSHAEGYTTTASGSYSHAEGRNTTASSNCSHAEGHDTYVGSDSTKTVSRIADTAAGLCGHAEGYGTISYGRCSHAEGNGTMASGYDSHAEGYNTTASGEGSHAEGRNTTASSKFSHAEGWDTNAKGSGAHAEGYKTTAGINGHAEGEETYASTCAHAEGYKTIAANYGHAEGGETNAGNFAHAEGYKTFASSVHQHAQGKYNIKDSLSTYAHIVGNGTSDSARSNAHTLDWNGVGWFQGGLQVGGNSQDDGAKNVLLEGDAIPVPTSAEVGQTIVVKSVDDDGAPKEWGAYTIPQADFLQNDETAADYMKNRTHWTEREKVILSETSLTQDGDVYATYLEDSIGLVAGNSYTVVYAGEKYTCNGVDLTSSIGTVCVGLGNLAEFGIESAEYPFIVLDAPDRFYTAVMGSGETTVSIVYEGVHKLDNKYLNLDWLPITEEKGDILPETVVSINTLITGTSNYYLNIDTVISYTAGQKVVVYVNGTRYVCEISEDDGIGYICAGALTMQCWRKYTSVISSAPGEYTLRICELEANCLPEEYLPAGVPLIQTAKVGQAVVVKTINDEGLPIEWGCADMVTDDHINELINTALGVIADGTY